jgi:hypothetical protein
MGRKRNDPVLILSACLAFAWLAPVRSSAEDSGPSVPYPVREHPDILLSIPTANVLRHGQYRLSGRFQYFNTAEIGAGDSSASGIDPSTIENLNYGSELLVGFENRAEIGVQYGKEPSFSIKALLLREDLFWPDFVFGARSLFGSEEGDLYGVGDEETLKDLQSETFAILAKTFGGSRVHMGLSVLTRANKGFAGVNAGLEQSLGAGAYMGYEVFERFSDFHQVFSLQWRYRDLVGFSLGMTEFQSWIRQGGRWGFFLTPSASRSDGYNSPGISFSLQVLGWVPHRDKRTLPERVAVLEVKNADLERQVREMEGMKARLADLEARGIAPVTPRDSVPVPAAPPTVPQQAVTLLKAIAEKSASDLTDPKDIRGMRANLVALGPEAAEVVKRAAADTAAGIVRVHALLVMGFSKDTAYVAPLRALCADRNPRIRREALTALVKVGGTSALEDSKRMLSDPDATVALAAGQAYRQLKGDRAGAKAPAPGKRGK